MNWHQTLNSLKGWAGGDFTEGLIFALSIQDLDQKLMHLLMEITSQHLFIFSNGASIFGQDQFLSPPAQDFQ